MWVELSILSGQINLGLGAGALVSVAFSRAGCMWVTRDSCRREGRSLPWFWLLFAMLLCDLWQVTWPLWASGGRMGYLWFLLALLTVEASPL